MSQYSKPEQADVWVGTFSHNRSLKAPTVRVRSDVMHEQELGGKMLYPKISVDSIIQLGVQLSDKHMEKTVKQTSV